MPLQNAVRPDSHNARGRWALTVVAAFLAAHIIIPVWRGDVYPFTSAPMFRDNPQQCCNYRVFAPDGRELPAADFLVQRVYDGNPLGYGVGICPPRILEEFGQICDEATLRRHVREQLLSETNRHLPYVDVQHEVIGPIDSQHIGVISKERCRVRRDE